MIVAGFPGPDELGDAVRELRAAGVPAETRTPYALPSDEDDPRSRIPLIALAAALVLGVGAFGMQCWAAMVSYKLLIGGRPDFFWTSYLIYALETAVLGAIVAAFGSFMIANRLPHLWDPSDESDTLREATRDGWFLVVRGKTRTARTVLRRLHPTHLEEMGREADEEAGVEAAA